MKKITVDAYYRPPIKGQELILTWIEKEKGKNVVRTLEGYKLLNMWYEGTELRCELYSPKSERNVITLFYYLCRDFNWEGKTKKLCEHYEVK